MHIMILIIVVYQVWQDQLIIYNGTLVVNRPHNILYTEWAKSLQNSKQITQFYVSSKVVCLAPIFNKLMEANLQELSATAMVSILHCVSKNDTDVAHYNFDADQPF